MIFDTLRSNNYKNLILLNRIIFIISIIILSFQPYITKIFESNRITKEFLFFAEIREYGEINFAINIVFIFFLLLLICFLIFNYDTNNFEILPLTLIPMLLYYIIESRFTIIFEIGYYLLIGAILIDIIVIFVLNNALLLDVEFLNLNSSERDNFFDNEVNLKDRIIKNKRLIAIFIFMFTPIAIYIECNLRYFIQKIIQDGIIDFTGSTYILTTRIPIIIKDFGEITLISFLFILIIELIILFVIISLFQDNYPRIITNFKDKIKNNNLLWFVSIIILALLIIFIGLSFMEFILLTIGVFLIYPFFVIPLLMIDKHNLDQRISFEGLFIIFIYSTIVAISILVFNCSLFGISVREFDSVMNSEMRPTMMLLFLPILAKFLWEEGKKLE